MANRTWVEGDVAFVEIVSPKYGVFISKCDAKDLPVVERHQWSAQPYSGKPTYAKTNRRMTREDGSRFQDNSTMHVLLFPDCPEGFVRDHVNGDGFDNRSSNVRFVNQSHNGLNRKTRKRKAGVSYETRANKYRARLFLGHFDTEDEAHEAWKNAYVKLHGSLPDCVNV